MGITHSSMLWEANHENSRSTFSLVSFLLQYPDRKWFMWRELREEASEITHSEIQRYLLEFIQRISNQSLDELAEEYVQTFDFSSKTNLYITYSSLGEEKERGTILVELKQIYQNAGFEVKTDELSDYLPLVLEFLSVAPNQLISEMLTKAYPSISKLAEELKQIESDYALLLEACILAAKPYLEGKGEGV
ncbi:MAG TPA: nitrate reductase molybdenum cofactor assembly chaperone [Bacillota bacterium]|nr:nitrate reductase molybdenum cofactor assembly chaperone [Bacillota bacterium]